MGEHKKEGSRPSWNKATVTLIQVQANQLDVTLDTMDTVANIPLECFELALFWHFEAPLVRYF